MKELRFKNFFNHLSGCCCMWKAIFAPRYLGAATEMVKTVHKHLLTKKIFYLTLKIIFWGK